jgi:hypothetical protein
MKIRPSIAAAALVALAAAPLPAQSGSPLPAPPPPRVGAPVGDEPLTIVSGIVYDSIGTRRLPGAIVQLVPAENPRGTSFGATADRNGRFRIDSVPAGPYLVGFFHPEIEQMGLVLPARLVAVYGARATLILATPSPATLARTLCPATPPDDSSATLTGYVRDADTGAPLTGSNVVMLWTDITIDEHGMRRQRRQFPIPVGEDGRYLACGVPSATGLTLRAERGQDVSGFVETEIPPRGLAWRDFGIGIADSTVTIAVDSTAGAAGRGRVTVRRGSAQLSGTVRTGDGRPVEGATVVVWGSGVEGTTDSQGRFLLTGLPSGTHNLEVRRIGYQPARIAVDLGRAKPATVAVALDNAVPVLEEVQVIGARDAAEDRSGFLRRSKSGFGSFISSEEIEKRHALQTSDLLRMTPGLQVVPSGPMGSTILMRGQCRPSLWVDGMQLMGDDSIDNIVRPSEIVGIEIYKSPGETPPQFTGSGGGGCGTIVVWTGARQRPARR